MPFLKNRKGRILVLAGLLASLTACTPPVEAPPSGSGKPAELRILYATAEANAAAVQAILPAFKEKYGIELKFDTQPYEALQQKVFSEFASSSSYYDIVIVDTPWAPALVGQLEPLDKYVGDPALNDIAPVALNDFIPKVFYDTTVYKADQSSVHYTETDAAPDISAITAKGFNVYGLPIQANAQVMAYRQDLFNDSKEQAAFKASNGRDLAVPKTWDEFRDVAKFFTRPAEKLYGTTVMAGVGDWATDDFKSMLAAWGGDGHLVSDDFRMSLASPEGVQALQFYTDLINKDKVVPPGSTSASWDEAASLFDAGTTALTMNYHSLELTDAVKGGQIGYAVVPTQKAVGPHFGTWMLSLNKYSNNKQWAYRAMTWLTSAEQQIAMTDNGLHPTRVSVYDAIKNSAKSGDEKAFYDVLGQSLAVGVGRARLTNYTEVSNAVAKAVNSAANGSTTPQAALEGAAAEVKRLLTEAGYRVP